jgi:hypothetical protein
MGMYVTNFQNRMDKTAYVLNYPNRPLVDTRVMNMIQLNKIPSGTNLIVAIMTHTGYNQEDSILINKGSIDRGMSLITLYLMGIIVNSVSPSFNGKSDLHQSLKLLTYASTPTWLAGLVGWIPILGALVSFAANVYVIYLIYLGLQPVLGVPKEKVAGFTVVIVLIYVVLSLIVSGIIIGLLFSTFFAGGATGALSGA